MTRAIRCSFGAALAALLVTAALPAAAADAAAPVDATTAEAAAQGAVCPAGTLNAEQLQVRQQAAIADIGRMLAEQETPDDPEEFRVLNGTGYNYRPPSPVAAPPASPAPTGTERH